MKEEEEEERCDGKYVLRTNSSTGHRRGCSGLQGSVACGKGIPGSQICSRFKTSLPLKRTEGQGTCDGQFFGPGTGICPPPYIV